MSYYAEGNLLSILAFFVWIPIALYGVRQLPPAKAMAFVFFGGLLFLPEVVFFKLPGLPEFAKLEIILTWILIGALLFHRQRLKSAPKGWQFKVCLVLLVIGSIFTVFLNMDGFRVGSREIPGHVPYDAVHAMFAVAFVVIPFYLGSAMFRTSGDLRVLLRTMAVAAILYSPLLFVEMRLSPQLHNWVYGFYQHSFIQTIRGTGYRPIVFMAHGLALALFVALAVVAAVVLYKVKIRVLRFPAVWAASYLWVTLLLCKSLASFLYGLIATPLVVFTSPRTQALVATTLVGFLFLYPVVLANDLIPIEAIDAFAREEFDDERADSLMFRFEQGQTTLDRALERPWFGWGGYCRACLFEPWSGKMESVRDGAWVITLGNQGIFGFIGRFSLLLFPLVALVRRVKFVPRESDRRLLAGLGLMVGLAGVDLVPNADFNRIPLLLSGALYGCLTGILGQAAEMRKRRRLERIASARTGRVGAAPAAGVAVLGILMSAAAAANPDVEGGEFAHTGTKGAYYARSGLESTAVAPSTTRESSWNTLVDRR